MTRKTKKKLDKIVFTGVVVALGGFLAWLLATQPG